MSYLKKFRTGKLPVIAGVATGLMLAAGISVWATSIGTDIAVTGSIDVQSTSATSTFSTGGINYGSGLFVVQQTSGRVGVGTSSPQMILSVQGGMLLSGTSSMAGLIATGTVLVSTEGGSTGVGTTTPVQKLSIGGSLFVGASAGGGTVGGLGVGNATTSAGAFENTGDVLFGDAATDKAMFSSGDIRLNNIGTTTISQRNVAGWSIATSSSPAPLLRYDTSNGRVGIATGTPDTTFMVNGNTHTTGGLAIGDGAATSTKGVIQTALSSTTPSVFQSDVSLFSTGTTTLRLGSQDGLGVRGNGGRGCIEFGNGEGGATFRIYATSTGFAFIESGPCE